MVARDVFVTGGTGYLGRPLIAALGRRGHAVRALVRKGSEAKLPREAAPVFGDALRAETWSGAVPPADTLVHLVGTPHPSPSKAQQFRDVDLASIRASTRNAAAGGVRHFVYVSVAHPAPVMRAYIAVRQEGEALVRSTAIPATVLRPWYVLGPGHWWPYAVLPIYALLSLIPWAAEGAQRLGLVTHEEMIAALVQAVEHPPEGTRIIGVPEIRASRITQA